MNRHPGLRLLIKTLKHVIAGDRNYIRKISELDGDSDLMEICHNGSTDYGSIVYVIKENTGYDGFCATLIYVIYFLLFAKEHGLAPVIKLSCEFAYYDREKCKEISNPWEYYFVPRDDACDESSALNVCYGNYHHLGFMKKRYDLSPYKAENYHDEKIFGLCLPVIRDYMRLRSEITNEASDILASVTERGGKVLGVHFRGTDYKQGFDRHPVFVDEGQTIEEIVKAMDTGRFDAVFVATDDASVCERIKETVTDHPVLYFPDAYRSNGIESVAFSKSVRKFHHYLLGYEIARDMYTLSLCDGLVAGKSSVGFMSNLYKRSRDEEYEYMHIIDNGNNLGGNAYFKES
ncbi:MAG: O-fucosyltransferase family protein [Lachnospiraceae bacterium]|nr:O-fucosyltransferase family protein [Lachnospiraceae bacterium]